MVITGIRMKPRRAINRKTPPKLIFNNPISSILPLSASDLNILTRMTTMTTNVKAELDKSEKFKQIFIK